MNVFVTIEKDVEVAAEKLLGWFGKAASEVNKIQIAEPKVVSALGTILGAVEAVVGDAAGVAANPSIALASETVVALKAVWPDVKAFAATLGIKL